MNGILLADDHVLVRQGLKALLHADALEVVAEASDGMEAVRLARELRPDVAVLDFSMPLLNGIDTLRELSAASPDTRSIVLSMYSEDKFVLRAIETGARGYLSKGDVQEELTHAVREVRDGRMYVSPRVSRAVVAAYRNRGNASRSDPLTSRERQVLQLVGEGKTTKEVAALLGVSVKTAETHRTRIMGKLDIHQTAGLVRCAIRLGLVQP